MGMPRPLFQLGIRGVNIPKKHQKKEFQKLLLF